MACIKFLILAPVYWETAAGLENLTAEILLSQDSSDFMRIHEVKLESSTSTKENQPPSHTSVIPNDTRTSAIPNASNNLEIPNSSRASGIPDDTRISGIPKSDLLSSLPSNLDRNYLNFPFLTDIKTYDYLNEKHTRVMFVMRGLSGSGKSSIVSMIKSAYKHVVVCSADDYFYKQDGRYVFDESLLSAAHETCQIKAKKACNGQVPIVIIDNTNVRRWELRFYTMLANSSGYVAVVVQPKTPWRWNAEELATRSSHGLSAQILKKKTEMFDDVIPLYYGWFPNKKHSEVLVRLCLKSFRECLSKFSLFKRDLVQQFRIPENTDEEIISGILSAYSEGTSCLLLHCTSKFCARGKLPEAQGYHKKLDVQQACGRMFVLQVAGLVLTHKSIGARVRLAPSDSVLFSRPEETEWDLNKVSGSHKRRDASGKNPVTDSSEEFYEVLKNGNRKAKKNPARFLKKQQRKQKNALKTGNQVGSDSVTEENEMTHVPELQVSQLGDAVGQSGINEVNDENVSLADMFPNLNFDKRTRSAHFTIKTTRGVESRDVNFDLLRACDVEAATSYTKSSFVLVSRGHACYYGDSLCCVYFDKPLHVQTLFSGYY